MKKKSTLNSFKAVMFKNNQALTFFVILCLLGAVLLFTKNTIRTIDGLQRTILTNNDHQLRLKYHRWYSQQYEIINYINNNVPNGVPILVSDSDNQNKCNNHFLPYYLAPRPVYIYSEPLLNNLKQKGNDYRILNMICKKKKLTKWSIENK